MPVWINSASICMSFNNDLFQATPLRVSWAGLPTFNHSFFLSASHRMGGWEYSWKCRQLSQWWMLANALSTVTLCCLRTPPEVSNDRLNPWLKGCTFLCLGVFVQLFLHWFSNLPNIEIVFYIGPLFFHMGSHLNMPISVELWWDHFFFLKMVKTTLNPQVPYYRSCLPLLLLPRKSQALLRTLCLLCCKFRTLLSALCCPSGHHLLLQLK